jgi:CRISPR-associated protein Cmr3
MIWLIEPVDPLIARDGRPFAAVPGARAKSLPFPPPSVIAGGVRTKAGLGTDGAFDESSIPALKTLAVRGPLLVDVDKNNAFLAPAPADALPFDITLESDNPRNEGESGGPADALPFETTPEKNSALEVKLLAPRPLPVNAHVDNGLDGLLPVGPAVADERKPANNPPAFWTWSRFEQWLVAPSDMTVKAADLGLNGPLAEARTHVAIDPDTQTGIDGRLFATGGLEFWHPLTPNDQPYPTARARRLALAVAIDDPHGSGLQPGEGYRPLGGERRLMHWTSAGMSLPSMPEGLATHIAETGRCRVILLTPAHSRMGGGRGRCWSRYTTSRRRSRRPSSANRSSSPAGAWRSRAARSRPGASPGPALFSI